MGPASLDDLRI